MVLANAAWFLAGLGALVVGAEVMVCIPIFISGRRVGRVEGGAMVGAYLAYLTFLLVTQT